MNIRSPRKNWVVSALGVAAVAAPAVLCFGAGTARADNANVDTASVQTQRIKVGDTRSLQVTVTDILGDGGPGTYGACSYDATPAGGTLDLLQGVGVPVAPLSQGFQLDQGGQQQLTFPGEVPTDTIWNVAISCTDPVQNQTGIIYNEQMPF